MRRQSDSFVAITAVLSQISQNTISIGLGGAGRELVGVLLRRDQCRASQSGVQTWSQRFCVGAKKTPDELVSGLARAARAPAGARGPRRVPVPGRRNDLRRGRQRDLPAPSMAVLAAPGSLGLVRCYFNGACLSAFGHLVLVARCLRAARPSGARESLVTSRSRRGGCVHGLMMYVAGRACVVPARRSRSALPVAMIARGNARPLAIRSCAVPGRAHPGPRPLARTAGDSSPIGSRR